MARGGGGAQGKTKNIFYPIRPDNPDQANKVQGCRGSCSAWRPNRSGLLVRRSSVYFVKSWLFSCLPEFITIEIIFCYNGPTCNSLIYKL